jgi:hypothetical protein
MALFSIEPRAVISFITMRFPVDVPKGTLMSRLREAGFSREEIIAFLSGE